MKLTIKENSKNYTCSVVKITNLYPIENADAIVRTVINGNNVVVPKHTEIGATMLYFVSGTKLSSDYCCKNNLYDKAEENTDTTKKGFIGFKQRRVKAIKLKGVISDGMLMPPDSLKPFLEVSSISTLKVGDEFTCINGNTLCEKYIVPVRNQSLSNGKPQKNRTPKISRLVDNQFSFHNDTSNLRKNMHNIYPGSILGIHYKKHGTSVVIGNVLTKRQLNLKEKIADFFGVDVVKEEYGIVYSSRKVIKNQYLNPSKDLGYYGEDIWGVVAKEVGESIPKGWTLYGEIIGFTPSGSAIQNKYDYGCDSGEHKFYVYKISIVDVDGNVTFLTDKQIEDYCEKVGFLYKDTFIYYGSAINFFDFDSAGTEDVEEWRNQLLTHLETLYNEKICYMCKNKVPEEGVIVRVENLFQYEAYKLKSKKFLLMESDEQEKEITNIEDAE